MNENEQRFAGIISELNYQAGTTLAVEDGICAFRTADDVQWQLSTGSGSDMLLIEGNVGALSQMPKQAAELLLRLNGDHRLTQGAAFALSEQDGIVRLQHMTELGRIDGVRLEKMMGHLMEIRDHAATRLRDADRVPDAEMASLEGRYFMPI